MPAALLSKLRRRVGAEVRAGLDRLSRHIPDRGLRDKPITEWSALDGLLYGIRVPNGMRSKPPGPEGSANINIIFDLLARTRDVPGDIAECGVFRGETLLAIALKLDQAERRSTKQVLGFDSFEGFNELVEIDKQLGGSDHVDKEIGGFSNTSHGQLLAKLRRWGLMDRVELVPGYFDATLSRFGDRQFSFVHLDCDLYESYRTCLEFFYPRLSPGAIVLLDEYNDPPWPGCNKAVDEFLADKPETLRMAEADGYQKWFFRRIDD
jgi:hypothetical protein